MKNQYFGDENDYQKFGLLRAIAAAKLRIMVCWMLTPPGNENEGLRLEYLDDDTAGGYDPDLFRKLKTLRVQGDFAIDRRNVALAEQHELVPDAGYFSLELKDKGGARAEYFDSLSKAAYGYDVLFFDPDNGLQTDSIEKAGAGSNKYIFWSELSDAWGAGHSLVVFQHFWRQKREDSILKRIGQIKEHVGVQPLVVVRFKYAFYLVIAQPEHAEAMKGVLDRFAKSWKLAADSAAVGTPIYALTSKHTLNSPRAAATER